MKIITCAVISALVLTSIQTQAFCIFCKKKKHKSQHEVLVQPQFVPGPPAVVYKTGKDYRNNVPIMLSEDKEQVISYPDPKDVRNNSKPTDLVKGYLLDNRGIGLGVAFTSITYDEYKNLPKPPSLSELKSLIIDNDPLAEMYNCGIRASFSDLPRQLNDIIKAGKLDSLCRKVK